MSLSDPVLLAVITPVTGVIVLWANNVLQGIKKRQDSSEKTLVDLQASVLDLSTKLVKANSENEFLRTRVSYLEVENNTLKQQIHDVLVGRLTRKDQPNSELAG